MQIHKKPAAATVKQKLGAGTTHIVKQRAVQEPCKPIVKREEVLVPQGKTERMNVS